MNIINSNLLSEVNGAEGDCNRGCDVGLDFSSLTFNSENDMGNNNYWLAPEAMPIWINFHN